jgi:hypothetical protein
MSFREAKGTRSVKIAAQVRGFGVHKQQSLDKSGSGARAAYLCLEI